MTPRQQKLVHDTLERAVYAFVDAEVSSLLHQDDALGQGDSPSMGELVRDGHEYLSAQIRVNLAIAFILAPDCWPTETTLDELIEERQRERMQWRQEERDGPDAAE